MLCWLALQVSTGLVSDDEIVNSGPLTSLVSSAVVSTATAWHKGFGKDVLIALVLLHVCAVIWYKLRKQQPLVAAMLHGDKNVPEGTPSSRDTFTSRLFAFGVLMGCAYGVYRLVQLGGAL